MSSSTRTRATLSMFVQSTFHHDGRVRTWPLSSPPKTHATTIESRASSSGRFAGYKGTDEEGGWWIARSLASDRY